MADKKSDSKIRENLTKVFNVIFNNMIEEKQQRNPAGNMRDQFAHRVLESKWDEKTTVFEHMRRQFRDSNIDLKDVKGKIGRIRSQLGDYKRGGDGYKRVKQIVNNLKPESESEPESGGSGDVVLDVMLDPESKSELDEFEQSLEIAPDPIVPPPPELERRNRVSAKIRKSFEEADAQREADIASEKQAAAKRGAEIIQEANEREAAALAEQNQWLQRSAERAARSRLTSAEAVAQIDHSLTESERLMFEKASANRDNLSDDEVLTRPPPDAEPADAIAEVQSNPFALRVYEKLVNAPSTIALTALPYIALAATGVISASQLRTLKGFNLSDRALTSLIGVASLGQMAFRNLGRFIGLGGGGGGGPEPDGDGPEPDGDLPSDPDEWIDDYYKSIESDLKELKHDLEMGLESGGGGGFNSPFGEFNNNVAREVIDHAFGISDIRANFNALAKAIPTWGAIALADRRRLAIVAGAVGVTAVASNLGEFLSFIHGNIQSARTLLGDLIGRQQPAGLGAEEPAEVRAPEQVPVARPEHFAEDPDFMHAFDEPPQNEPLDQEIQDFLDGMDDEEREDFFESHGITPDTATTTNITDLVKDILHEARLSDSDRAENQFKGREATPPVLSKQWRPQIAHERFPEPSPELDRRDHESFYQYGNRRGNNVTTPAPDHDLKIVYDILAKRFEGKLRPRAYQIDRHTGSRSVLDPQPEKPSFDYGKKPRKWDYKKKSRRYRFDLQEQQYINKIPFENVFSGEQFHIQNHIDQPYRTVLDRQFSSSRF